MPAAKDNVTAGYPPVTDRLRGPVARLASYPTRARQFLHEVRQEMHHVTWPTRPDVRATTVVVIIAVFFFGFYFGVLDRGLTNVMDWLLRFAKGLVG